MLKNPYTNAVIASLYIIAIVSLINLTSHYKFEENLIIPMVMLSLFVLSAALMGVLFFYEPARLFLEDHKSEALTFFGKTLGTFAVITFLLGILFLSTTGFKFEKKNIDDIKAACENALAYTTFPDADSADAFVQDCIDGKHPEVIERYDSNFQ